MKRICLAMAVSVLLAQWPALAADGPASDLDITLRKPADRAAASTDGQAKILTVTSPSGIGGATITPKAGKWPETVTIRLRLGGLESLTVSNGKATLSTSVSSHGDGKAEVHLTESGKQKSIDSKSPYWMELRVLDAKGNPTKKIPVQDGYFEFTVPKALMGDGIKSITLNWIDFYRG
jgi:hypothetical protein